MVPAIVSSRPPSRAILLLSVALMCAIWGSTWVVIAEGLDDLPPFTSAAARFAVAALLMAWVARRWAAREGGAPPPRHLVLVMGTCNFSISYGIVYWTETRLPSGLVSVLWAVFPMLMAGVGHFFLPGERLRARQWLGMLVGFGGVAYLFRTDLASTEGAWTAGAILLLSPLVSAFGTAFVKRDGGGVSSLLLNRDGMLVGALLLALLAAATEHDAPQRWTGPALLSVGYLAVFGTCLTFGLYYWVMRYAAAYQLSLIAYVTPVIALSLGSLVRGEETTATLVTGGAIVLVGVGMVMLGKQRRPAKASGGAPQDAAA